MTVNESAEDYLETILVLKNSLGMVRSIDIVNEMNYSKPSISIAMKKLRENGFITVDDGGYISLTEEGMRIAEKTYAKHKVLQACLEALGVETELAAEEACHIEHVIDDDTCQKICDFYHMFMEQKIKD
ncbi:MAG: metal-dependent transcriptional regulator [Lachnospiraceae bacterium]|nr:metal-dependent transcriptional regulator [Lachnospiraceae bacterium]